LPLVSPKAARAESDTSGLARAHPLRRLDFLARKARRGNPTAAAARSAPSFTSAKLP
jgi:hypothetical protein